MSLGKKEIIKNISSKAQISNKQSLVLLETFLIFLKRNKNTKISNFGTFSFYTSPKRIGRNPKTKIEYEIKSMKKLRFNPSSRIKQLLN